LLNVGLLVQNRILGYSLLVQWLLYCNAFGAVFLLSLYLQSALGYGADVAGYVLAVGTLLMALIAPASGALADRTRPALIASTGVAVVLAAAVMAAFLGASSSLVAVGAVLAVQGVGFAFFSSPNMAMVMNAVPRERSGIAAALSASARSLGMVSGMLIVGALISVKLGHEPVGADPARYIATMHLAFWVLAAVTAAALAISAARVR
jgi:MFS family permease